MARYSPSQIRSKIRQLEQKNRQAVNNLKRAVNDYNRAVRSHNARVRSDRQRLMTELARLRRQPAVTRRITATTTVRYVSYQQSVQSLHQTYERLEERAQTRQYGAEYNRILDLSERETANSLEVTNQVLGDGGSEEDAPIRAHDDTELRARLRSISTDLDNRWTGAVFALNGQNPDAARHFGASAREILTQILETKAPDADVFALLPACQVTDRGNPTRRTKIRYLLRRQGLLDDVLEDFVEEDMENVVQLFQLLNDATHGSAGAFDMRQLSVIRSRVEDGIMFLTEIAGDS